MEKSSTTFYCYVCRDGLAITSRILDKKSLSSDILYHFGSDKKGDKIIDSLPLGVRLTSDDVLHLTNAAHSQVNEVVFSTHYGPESQEKPSNQDFALGAVINDASGNSVKITTVADGVSTQTFWPARSSRLACIIAIKSLSSSLLNNNKTIKNFINDEEINSIHSKIINDLQIGLKNDKKDIEATGKKPDDLFKPYVYEMLKDRDDERHWYATTLLITAITNHYALFFYVGDGAVVVQKKKNNEEKESIVLLRSTDSLAINKCVSLKKEEALFNIAKIQDVQIYEEIIIVTASDGVDRSFFKDSELENNEDAIVSKYLSMPLGSSKEAWTTLDALAKSEESEVDNYSISKIYWKNRLSKSKKEEAEVNKIDTTLVDSKKKHKEISNAVKNKLILSFLVGIIIDICFKRISF